MTVNRFKVETYRVAMGSQLHVEFQGGAVQFRAAVSAIGEGGEQITAYFGVENAPAPWTDTDASKAAVFLPYGDLSAWVDILRNEIPIFGYINTEIPGFTSIRTGLEPVGEGETMTSSPDEI